MGLIAVSTVPMALLRDRPEWSWYPLGLVHGALLAAFVGVVWSVFVASDETAINHVRGAWGEENTRDPLRTAQRRRLIWGWVDSLTLEYGDIDHLVVTRAGGVVAIDSKWRSRLTEPDREEIAQSARKVRLRSQSVVSTLLRSERGSHRARGGSVQVTPLVVVWGAAQRLLPETGRTEGVEIVGGRGLLAWLRERGGEAVDKAAAEDLLRRLTDYGQRIAVRSRSGEGVGP